MTVMIHRKIGCVSSTSEGSADDRQKVTSVALPYSSAFTVYAITRRAV